MPSKFGHKRCEISDPTDIADVFLPIFANRNFNHWTSEADFLT